MSLFEIDFIFFCTGVIPVPDVGVDTGVIPVADVGVGIGDVTGIVPNPVAVFNNIVPLRDSSIE